jgi:hypothetical protein
MYQAYGASVTRSRASVECARDLQRRGESLRSGAVRPGAIAPFNWSDWDGLEIYRGGGGLEAAPVAEAVRMATAIVRADRFTEGALAASLTDGTFLVLRV